MMGSYFYSVRAMSTTTSFKLDKRGKFKDFFILNVIYFIISLELGRKERKTI